MFLVHDKNNVMSRTCIIIMEKQTSNTLCNVLWLAIQSPILSIPESTCNIQWDTAVYYDWIFMPWTGQTDYRHNVLNLSICPSICQQTYEQDIVKIMKQLWCKVAHWARAKTWGADFSFSSQGKGWTPSLPPTFPLRSRPLNTAKGSGGAL